MREQFLSNSGFLRIALAFTRHEAWAIRTAMRFPFFAIFIHATLWGWVLLITPALVVGAYAQRLGIVGLLLIVPLGLGILALIFPWSLRWYFVCVGLMFGRPRMAQVKAAAVAQSLAGLEAHVK
ncbi:hypothetical protein [Sulfitobacter sp.]|uniref:hypothetical protein n=1 Tax=Sulfitobacter sp. TaxID=1903071 RepID=UPI003EF2D6DB